MTVSTISVREAKAKFSELGNRVFQGGERFIISRHGKPFVALVRVDDLERLQDLSLDQEHQAEPVQALRELKTAYLNMSERERQTEVTLAEEGLQGQLGPDEAFPEEGEWPWWE